MHQNVFRFNSVINKLIINSSKRINCFAIKYNSIRNTNNLASNEFQIELKTCAKLYKKADSLKHWNLRGGPPDGLQVSVRFVDTKSDERRGKTILALHSTPGSREDFDHLVNSFGAEHRVIVPNFPDFSLTQTMEYFWHSGEEKAQFIRDFLSAIKVSQIDCLIAHSSAIFPASFLWMKDEPLNKDINIKSLAFFNSPGPKWIRSRAKIKLFFLVHFSRLASIRFILSSIWSHKMSQWTSCGFKTRIEGYDQMALLWSSVFLSRSETFNKRLKHLKEQKIPTLFVFSHKDRLFDKDIFYDELKTLEASLKNFDVYEQYENKMVQKGENDDWLKVVNIRGGGNFCFVTHSHLIHKYLQNLLTKLDEPVLIN